MLDWKKSRETKICGVIGDPVEHSMSPLMHNAAFRKLGLDYIYVPFRVKKEDLKETVESLRTLYVRGFNVTIPHKVAIIPFLDRLDSVAEKIGAVNTVVNDGGVLIGYNTDAAGFLKATKEKGVETKGKNIIVLGAGGAARAISFILAQEGANLIIINRTIGKAREQAVKISQIFQREVGTLPLDRENLKKALEKANILINATSVGMSPNANETLVDSELIKPSLVVFDIVYNPFKTRLLREAERAGAQTISGVEMLVWQGASAFEKWTGVEAPVKLMREEVVKDVGKA